MLCLLRRIRGAKFQHWLRRHYVLEYALEVSLARQFSRSFRLPLLRSGVCAINLSCQKKERTYSAALFVSTHRTLRRESRSSCLILVFRASR